MNKPQIISGNQYKRICISIILIIIVSILGWHLSTKRDNQNVVIDNTAKRYEPSFKKEGQLVFIKKTSNEMPILIAIEIADNEEKRTQGLMWRQSMPDSVGMLFIFEEERPLSFWMKNTYIPLDIIFIDNKFNIITIEHNTIPLSETLIPSRTSARYAVEVNAWFCQQHGISVGDKIRWDRRD